MTNPERPLPITDEQLADLTKIAECMTGVGDGYRRPGKVTPGQAIMALIARLRIAESRAATPADADEAERVARAMYFVSHSYGWENEDDSLRWEYLELASAAIAAMSKPAAAATTEDMPRGEYEAHVAQFAKANRELRLRAEKSESDVAVERAFHRQLVDERDSWFALFNEVSRHLGCNARCLVDGNPHVIERARYLSSMFTGDRYVATERAERERDAARAEADLLRQHSMRVEGLHHEACAEVERLRAAITAVGTALKDGG